MWPAILPAGKLEGMCSKLGMIQRCIDIDFVRHMSEGIQGKSLIPAKYVIKGSLNVEMFARTKLPMKRQSLSSADWTIVENNSRS